MGDTPAWDFRSNEEQLLSKTYEEIGYVVKDGNYQYLELLKKEVEKCFKGFDNELDSKNISLAYAHQIIKNEKSNDLRLHIMANLFKQTSFHKNYYHAAKDIVHALCGNELVMQRRPGISINLPQNNNDVLPIHADTWNGVSPYELNIWIPFVDCFDSMCLYILKRSKYLERLENSKGLLKLTSDELFDALQDDLTWVPIKYGQILAFDQSLPHGYSLNEECFTHWTMNCRFKGLHTPYWDKKLGEYFMPITVRSSTRLGMDYVHPKQWT